MAGGNLGRPHAIPRLALTSLALIVAALGLLPRPAAASAGWEIVLDRPTPNFGAVDFVSGTEGWLPAGAGLLHTTDGGATWTEAAKITVGKVAFFDREHGWAVGLSGAIYGTGDGGTTWAQQNSGTAVHLSDVAAISATEAWAVGAGSGFSDVITPPPVPSVLLHTSDGGRSWQNIDPPANSSYREIAFVGDEGWLLLDQCEPNPDYGYCTYQPSPTPVLQHTRDGGRTWDTLPAPAGQDFLSELTFWNAQDGWVTGTYCSTDNCYDRGDHSAIFRTKDGGLSWAAVDTSAYGRVIALAFKDELRGWALARACPRSGEACLNNFLSTDDGGASWLQVSQTRLDNATYGDSLRHHSGVLFKTSFSGLAVRSTDSGRSWQELRTPALTIWDVAVADSKTGYAAGDRDILRTDDSGRSWTPVTTPGDDVRLLAFSDNVHGVAASRDCSDSCLRIYRTSDGGASWQVAHQVSTLTSQYPISMRLTNSGIGLLALEGNLLNTTDGGLSWQEHALPESESVLNAGLTSDGLAWAVIHRKESNPFVEQLRISKDGGGTWEDVPLEAQPSVSVSFADRDHGWYVSQTCQETCTSTLHATEDGGATWAPVGDVQHDYIADLTFIDARDGWAVGTDYTQSGTRSAILHTTDGGQSWETQVRADEPLAGYAIRNGFDFDDHGNGWFLLDPLRNKGIGGGPPSRTIVYHLDGGTKLPDVGRSSPANDGDGFAPSLLLAMAAAAALTAAAALALRRRRA